MKCQTVRELLSEYVDNELDQKLHSEIKEHINICPECKREEEDFIMVKKALRIYSDKDSEPSSEFSEKLCEMFKGTYVSCDENKAKVESRLIFCLICLAICVVIALSNSGFSLGHHKQNQGSSYVVQSEERPVCPKNNRFNVGYIINRNNN